MSKPSRRSRGTLTIEDVARAAGVSAMTVSRVINKERNVKEETRLSVLETIERLNYSPNTAARNLAAGEAMHIGLLYSNPSAAYLSQFLVGALESARAAGVHLVIEPCESEDEAEQCDVARSFAQADAKGVILPPPLSESVPILSELALSKTPVVTVAMGQLYPNALNVRIDDFAAAKEMTDYLIGLGHRCIALITGHPEHIASLERERGFFAAVDGAGRGRRFFSVTLPLLTPIIFFNLVLQVIGAFQSFTQAFVVSGGTGGPADSTMFYTLYLYQKGFTAFDMGYASAMAWLLVFIVGVMTAINFFASKFWVFYDD